MNQIIDNHTGEVLFEGTREACDKHILGIPTPEGYLTLWRSKHCLYMVLLPTNLQCLAALAAGIAGLLFGNVILTKSAELLYALCQ